MPLFQPSVIGCDELGWEHVSGESASRFSCCCTDQSSSVFHQMNSIYLMLH